VIGSGVWGQKVSTILNQSGFKCTNLGARNFLSVDKSQNELTDVSLIWICSTPELQLKCVKNILEITKAKILIEKPISQNLLINSEVLSLIEGNDNIFISRPWNYSKIWRSFLADCISQGEILHLDVRHFGEIVRDFITPPQDWLHHDICLLEEIISFHKYKNMDFQTDWSADRDSLRIIGNGDITIEVNGGFSETREFSISVTFKNKTKMVLNLNEKSYSMINAKNQIKTLKFETNDSIPTMIDHLIKLNTNLDDRLKERNILNSLQLLSI
jgi:hypothetical protein